MSFNKNSRSILKFLSIIFSLLSATTGQADDKSLALLIKDNSKFEVLLHRAKSTATGAVLGGLIGAGIEDGVRSNHDNEKKSLLLNRMDEPSCSEELISTLIKKLEKKEFQIEKIKLLKDAKKSKKTFILELDIKNCGFKLVNSTNIDRLAAFVEFKSKFYLAGEKKPKSQSNLFLGKRSYTFNELLDTNTNLSDEMSGVLKKSGKRLASKIIYSNLKESK